MNHSLFLCDSIRSLPLSPELPYVTSPMLTPHHFSLSKDGKSKLPADPTSQFVTFTLENGAVVSLRTSGTEPKLKWYVEAVGGSEEEGRYMCERLVQGVLRDLIKIEAWGDKLELPST